MMAIPPPPICMLPTEWWAKLQVGLPSGELVSYTKRWNTKR